MPAIGAQESIEWDPTSPRAAEPDLQAPRRTRRRATKRMAESVARMIPSPMVVIVPSGLSDRFLWDKTGESLRFSREM